MLYSNPSHLHGYLITVNCRVELNTLVPSYMQTEAMFSTSHPLYEWKFDNPDKPQPHPCNRAQSLVSWSYTRTTLGDYIYYHAFLIYNEYQHYNIYIALW